MRCLLALVVFAGCFSADGFSDTCAPDDVDCWTMHLAFVDDSGNRNSAVIVDEATVEALSTRTSGSSSAPSLFTGSASFDFSDGTVLDGTQVLLTELLDVAFSDPNGCSPVLGLTVAHGPVRSKHTGCFPGIHDMKTSGSISAFFSFEASATAPTSLTLDVVPISTTDCTSIGDPATVVASATAVAGVFVTAPLTIAPPPSSGSGDNTCPGGLLASTLECDPIGQGGTGSTCISAASYMQATGMPLPSACAAAGVSGCENSSGTLVHPCCPGLTCEVGAACGDATNAVGGTCH